MLFINPIEILELQQTSIATIDDNVIKKGKKKVYAEIDLSDDGHLEYKGQKISKSDCGKAIDDLNKSTNKEYYYHLANENQLLNNYLVYGEEKLFTSYKQESIYKLPDFIEFINPYFAHKFDRSLLKAFKSNNLNLFKSILRTQSLINQSGINTAYKSVTVEIQNRIFEVDKIKQEIKDDDSDYTKTTINEILDIVTNYFPIELINSLPTYFQSQINKIGTSLNYLQLSIIDSYGSTQVALDLLVYLLQLNIESVNKPTFQKNYEIIKRRNDERIEQEKNAPQLKRWALILLKIKDLTKNVEDSKLTANEALTKIVDSLNVNELNDLPQFANEIRNQIGYSLRSLSISAWNNHQDIKTALSLMQIALQLNVSNEIRVNFEHDNSDLKAIEQKYKGIIICYFCDKNIPDEDCKINKTIYKENTREYRRVQYSYAEVEIPRCKSCQAIHSSADSLFWMCLFAGIILGVIFGAIADIYLIIGGIAGCVVGGIIGKIMEVNKITKTGIKTMFSNSLASHPILIERMQNGWTFSKPSA